MPLVAPHPDLESIRVLLYLESYQATFRLKNKEDLCIDTKRKSPIGPNKSPKHHSFCAGIARDFEATRSQVHDTATLDPRNSPPLKTLDYLLRRRPNGTLAQQYSLDLLFWQTGQETTLTSKEQEGSGEYRCEKQPAQLGHYSYLSTSGWLAS